MNANATGTENAIRWEYQTTVSVEEGMKRIEKAINEAFEAALTFKNNDRIGDVFKRLLRTTTGSGKTWTVLKRAWKTLKKFPWFRILFLTTSIKDSQERKAEALEIGIPEDMLTVWRGRNQPTEDSTPEEPVMMCRKFDVAAILSGLQVEIGTTLCKGKNPKTGAEEECEHYATCPYILQMQEAKKGGIVFASHQYLSVKADALKDFDLVIVDENPTQALFSTKKIDLGRFMTWRTMGDGFYKRADESGAQFEERKLEETIKFTEAIDGFKQVIELCAAERRHPAIEDFRNAGFDETLAQHIGNLEYTRIPKIEISPGVLHADQLTRLEKEKVREAFGLARVWRCLETEFKRDMGGFPHSIEIRYDDADANGTLRNNIVCKWHRSPNFADTPILILDASAPVSLYKKLWPGLDVVSVNIEYKNVYASHGYDWSASMGALKTESNRDDIYNLTLAQQIRLAPQIAGRPERQPVIISTKSLIEDGMTYYRFAGIRFMWFGNTRGKNEAKYAAAVNVYGRIMANARDLQDMACAYYCDDPIPLVLIEPDANGNIILPKRKVLMTAKDGSEVIVEVPYHPDPRVNELFEMISYGEQDQAIGRGRFIWREETNPCELNIFSPLPLPFQPDRFIRKREAMPDNFDLAYMAGFMPETSSLFARMFPKLYRTAVAVRVGASRRGYRAFPLFAGCYNALYNNIKASVTRWVRATFTLSDSGNRVEKMAMRLEEGERIEDATARLLEALPDAMDIDMAIIAQETAEDAPEALETAPVTSETPAQPAVDPETGCRVITIGTLRLAVSSSPEPLLWDDFRLSQKYFGGRVPVIPANNNTKFQATG